MFRLAALTFGGQFRGSAQQESAVHENGSAITIPLILLAVLSIVGGFVGIPAIFAADAHLLHDFLAPVFAQSGQIAAQPHPDHETEWLLAGITTVLSVIVSFVAWNRFKKTTTFAEVSTGFARVVENKFYVDELYHAVFVKPYVAIARLLEVIDRRVIDGLVNGVGKGVHYASRQVRLLQSGYTSAYILLMVIGLLLFFIIQMFTK